LTADHGAAQFDSLSTLIGLVVAILVAAIPVAFDIGRKRGKQAQREELLSEVKNTIESVRLVDFRASPSKVLRGDQVLLEYTIKGSSKNAIEVWLGAHFEVNGNLFPEIAQDKVVRILEGVHFYQRSLN
jgi:hypothetical protein